MGTLWPFPIFIIASIIIFFGAMRVVLRHRATKPGWWTYIWVCGVVTVVGMIVAKAGQNLGLPLWFYYGVPAATTWLLPPLVFKMRAAETGRYLALAFLTAPTIHILFRCSSDGANIWRSSWPW
jgi:hypothetical protein